MADAAQATPDDVIARLPKNAREEWRFTLAEFNGRRLAHVRAWVTDKGEGGIPTRNGLSLRVEQLPEVAEALMQVHAEAVRRGLVPKGNAR